MFCEVGLALLILMSGAAVVAAIVVLLRNIARNAGAIVPTINRIMPSKTASLPKRAEPKRPALFGQS